MHMRCTQHPVTGLLPAFLYNDGTPGWARNDAWVRDNVYCVLSIWGMSIAFRRQAEGEEDRMKAFQLEQVGRGGSEEEGGEGARRGGGENAEKGEDREWRGGGAMDWKERGVRTGGGKA